MGEMEIRFGVIDGRPGQPVRVGSGVGTLVEICPPQSMRPWRTHLAVSPQQVYRDGVPNSPGYRFLDFRVQNGWQRMRSCYIVTIVPGDLDPSFPRRRVEMEEHGTATIHFKVKIPLRHIRARCKEEFNTTIPANSILMFCGYCPDVPVLHPEHDVYNHLLIRDFHLRLRKMVRLLPHIVLYQLRRDLVPWRLVPTRTDPRRVCQSCYFGDHLSISPFEPLHLGTGCHIAQLAGLPEICQCFLIHPHLQVRLPPSIIGVAV